jgi:hypothetical protein
MNLVLLDLTPGFDETEIITVISRTWCLWIKRGLPENPGVLYQNYKYLNWLRTARPCKIGPSYKNMTWWGGVIYFATIMMNSHLKI